MSMFSQLYWNTVWINFSNEPDYAQNPYSKADYIVTPAPDTWTYESVTDAAAFDETWNMLGDSAAVAKLVNDEGDLFNLDEINPTFGTAWKAIHDGTNLYVLFKHRDLAGKADAQSLRLEVMAQTSPLVDQITGRYPAIFDTATTLEWKYRSYARFIQHGGGKTDFNNNGAANYNAQDASNDFGSWAQYEPGLSGIALSNHFWDDNGSGLIRAILVMPFSSTLSYPNNPSDLTVTTAFDPMATPDPDTILFDIKSNVSMGEQKVEYFWSANEIEGYTSNYYSGRLIFAEGDVLWPTVESPVYYCVGEPSAPLEAEGTNLTWYSSQDGTGQSTPFTPSTEVAGH